MEPQNIENPSGSSGSSKKYILIAVVVIVLGGISWFFSRGGIIAPPGVDVDRNLDGSATYKTDDGSITVGATNTYPDNWPSDAPKYAGAQLQYSASSNQDGSNGAAVVFTTSDSTQKVLDFYKNELATNGWAIEQTATMGAMSLVAGNKGNTVFAAQIVTGDDGQTSVTVSIGNQ